MFGRLRELRRTAEESGLREGRQDGQFIVTPRLHNRFLNSTLSMNAIRCSLLAFALSLITADCKLLDDTGRLSVLSNRREGNFRQAAW